LVLAIFARAALDHARSRTTQSVPRATLAPIPTSVARFADER
jgi:hypothetical protein